MLPRCSPHCCLSPSAVVSRRLFIASSCSSRSTLQPCTSSYVRVHSGTSSSNPYVPLTRTPSVWLLADACDSSRMSSRTRTGSSCVTIRGRISASLFVGALSWRTCSLVRSCPPFNEDSTVILLITDGNLALVPLVSRGVEDNKARVHAGFLISYNSVRSVVLRAMREQLKAFPGYVVVFAGMLCYSSERLID